MPTFYNKYTTFSTIVYMVAYAVITIVKNIDIQPMVELHPRFIVPATCFDVVAGDRVPIVNITSFNLWLNHAHVLQPVRHVFCIILLWL